MKIKFKVLLTAVSFSALTFSSSAITEGFTEPTYDTTERHMTNISLAEQANRLNLMLKPAPTQYNMMLNANKINQLEYNIYTPQLVDDLKRHALLAGVKEDEVSPYPAADYYLNATSEPEGDVGSVQRFIWEHYKNYGLCSSYMNKYLTTQHVGFGEGLSAANYCTGTDYDTDSSATIDDFKDLNIRTILGQDVVNNFEFDISRSVAKNLVNPLFKRIGGDKEEVSFEDFNKELLKRGAYSVPYHTFFTMIESRRAIPETNEDGAVTGYHSAHSVMKKQNTERVENPQWSEKLATLPSEGILREIAHMMAISVYNQQKLYEQNERMEANMAILATKMSELAAMSDPEQYQTDPSDFNV